MQSCRHGGGAFGAWSPQKNLQAPPNLIMKFYKSVEFLSNFQNVKSPWTNINPPYWKNSGEGYDSMDSGQPSLVFLVNELSIS